MLLSWSLFFPSLGCGERLNRALASKHVLRRAEAWVILAMAGMFLLIGVLFIAAPKTGAAVFGIPTEETAGLAYVRAVALRDVALGLYLLGLLRFSSRRGIGIVLAATVIIPAGDILLILEWHGLSSPGHLLLHGFSGVVVATVALWLLWETSGAE